MLCVDIHVYHPMRPGDTDGDNKRIPVRVGMCTEIVWRVKSDTDKELLLQPYLAAAAHISM